MANYNNINISKSFLESKRNAYDMGQDGNQSYIVSTFAILNNISESKSRFILNDHIFTEFLKSNKSNFDSFVLQEMKYKKEDTMIGSDIPQSVRPERPIDDEEDYKESLYEEDENDIDINDEYDIEENDSEDTDSDTSNLPPTVIQFLKDTKLLNASDKEAKTFLLRFKDVLTEAIDNESAIQLIILLLYKAKFEPETMSSGEIEELEDIVFNFTNEPDSDTNEDDNEIQESYYKSLFEDEPKKKKKTDSDDKTSKLDKINKVKDDIGKEVSNTIKSSAKSVYDKYPITSVLVGGAALLGLGSLALLGWYMFSKLSDIEYKKAKQKLIDEDIISDIQKGEIQNIKTTIESSDVIPKDQIKIPEEFSMTGFKAFEKTTLQSIFDTQKPFMEIVGVAIGSVAKAEDVIARVMPFFGDPLTVKSRKPKGNAGSGKSRPKAIGYKGAAETKEKLQKLNSIQASTVKKDTSNIGGGTSSNPNNVTLNITNQTTNTSGFNSQNWKVISTVYSTGTFEPNVDYTYTYINLPADEPLPEVDPVQIEDTDPYDNYKPKSMIFGIYNSKG
jgi:hypothetical protein